jgi:transcription elongation factor GreA-like protein
MTIKRGNVVSHAGAIEWGVGKVVEVTPLKATIQFSDGIIRKIASSHYTTLQPADPAAFVPLPDSIPVVKVRATPKRAKKTLQPVA